ncbi:histidine triad nucleotide-binding protein [Carboxydothermus islandicus]|uniref:Histidine triad nucleotide-binding protein n=1 Tax=Carboxydothermus islandicus TaxID=661089 RepID=A0A1L8D2Y5_9THEO|nr:histidine triad nucleotide-binding protein [Carboxydothermus islandicus]GAV25477.1 histidine triad nucleotide-binding protein [Carboxydothermus islandicus]
MSDCLFCRIARKEISSAIVYEDELVVAFRDINPVAPVHILIVPKVHLENIADLGEEHRELAGHLLLKAREIAEKEGISDSGYRLVSNCRKDGGQEIYHLHFHLIGGRPLGKFA